MTISSFKDSPISWSTCPSHIIIKISSYINPTIAYKLRLINKHWSKFVSETIFYSNSRVPEDKMDHFIEKYNLHIKFWDNFSLTDGCMLKFMDKIKYLDEIEWRVRGDKTVCMIAALKKYTMIKILWLEFIGGTILDVRKLDEFFDSLVSLTKLKKLYICAYSLDILHCISILPFLTLKQLTLKCDSKYAQSILNCYKELQQLEEFNLVVVNMEYFDSPSDSIFPRPSQFLQNINLKILKVVICDSITDSNLRSNLADEIITIFSNNNFSNLNYFSFIIFFFDGRLPQTTFDLNFSLNLSTPMINLTHLHLIVVDQYLLAYVIENFPNLTELATFSPLTYPIHANLSSLKPLHSLKKLLIGGFHTDLHLNSYHIKRLFPNVVTLNCFESDLSPLTFSRDAGLIPECFPNLTKLIIRSSEYILERLLRSEFKLKWEELYLKIDHMKLRQYQQLVAFNLQNLKILYVDRPTYNLYKVTKKAKVMLYRAYMYKAVAFSIHIFGLVRYSYWTLLKSKLKLIINSKMRLNR
ncbi:hypothetical protein CONCODRAFT_70847 [Conidiobolus coronatus NRRL 28638]|uniref:F-box domain-containing protein n=1 Tax=Conidiobolus coronatus (strain ATCC 28846 / CBS 209.66 / NRRL 28638) TaxID=796925 RepID=A0A137P5C4_CONC2|nr:hypothetical protein CONCODRAFT_70847 [Conidiobolus coronatus NRRL 28638]|eukprot:KXN70208.1 hypothetical protein CONCODRAFT_70847 [Conidiobolus coronatus NRRL 28638]